MCGNTYVSENFNQAKISKRYEKLQFLLIIFPVFMATKLPIQIIHFIHSKLLYHMFLDLWSEITLFHKLIYDIAQGSILIGLDVAVRLWRHRQHPDVGAFSAVKSVIKFDKNVFFLRFCEFNMW